MVTPLETRRLALGPFAPGDADLLVELHNDPEVMRFINAGAPVPRDQIVGQELPGFLAHDRRGDGYGFWKAVERASGAFIGWFHLRCDPLGDQRDPELGYRLRRGAWGHGFATEGAVALVDRAFGELGAERVHAEAMAVHAASRRVMENAGLRWVRTFQADWPVRIEGDEQGDVEYAITRSQWRRARAVRPGY